MFGPFNGSGRFAIFGFKAPICPIKGCAKEGVYKPVVVVQDPRPDQHHLEFHMQVPVCEEHRIGISLHHSLTPALWAEIRKGFRALRGVEPNYNDVSLEFESPSGIRFLAGATKPKGVV
jgi:hypothetical protein